MKRLILFLAIFSAMTVMAENRLVVWQKDGTTSEFAFDRKPDVNCQDNAFVVTTLDTQVSFPLVRIQKVTFEYEAPEGIDAPTLDPKDLKSGEIQQIYGLDGRARVDLRTLPPGVYVVKSNGVTYKILKK